MKEFRYKSLKEYAESLTSDDFDDRTLIISDIDGVFFRGVFDPREILGIIGKTNISVLESLLSNNPALWLFTNRSYFFRRFPYIRQLRKTIKKTTTINPEVYSDCSSFLIEFKNSMNYAIIMSAQKPDSDSQKVVEKGIQNFRRVIYIAAKDTPFVFPDEELLQRLEEKDDLSRLWFIKIGPF